MALRILLDEGISREVARELTASGYDRQSILDLGLKAQPDPVIFRIAQERQAALCTLNRHDFHLLVIAWREWRLGPYAGLITPRAGRQPKPGEIVQALRALCDAVSTLQNQAVYI